MDFEHLLSLPSAQEPNAPFSHEPITSLAHVETAFTMTIHKSQGSEFAHTVMVVPPTGGDILTRELIYTAITRARQNLTVVEPQAGLLGKAVSRKVRRVSGLSQTLEL